MKFLNIIIRLFYISKDLSGKEKRKRKVSIEDSTRGERLEKISKEEGIALFIYIFLCVNTYVTKQEKNN